MNKRIQIFSDPLKQSATKWNGPWPISWPLGKGHSMDWALMLHRWMDNSVDKEFAGQSHSKTCSQWLNVEVETSDKGHSLGISTGTSAVQHLYWQHGPCLTSVCRWHQAVRCSWLVGGKGCHPEGPGQAWEVGLCETHNVQQGQVQGPAHG